MKKTTYYLILASLTLLGGTALLIKGTAHKYDNPRAKYVQYLRSEYQSLPNYDTKEIEAMPKMDRPDLAGLDEYFKTVDPELKTVPQWRSVEAYEQLKSEVPHFKSMDEELTWTAHPTDMGGRTRSIMFDPNDPTHSKLWAGSVTGGLWYNDDPINGLAWQPVNDFYSNLSISSLTYDPNNTSVFYAGTGESQTALIIYRESSGRGSGLYKSSDAGESWDLIPSTAGWAYITDVIVRNEDGQSVVYAAVISGIYKGKLHESQPSDGLYRSTDGGATWSQVLPLVPSGNRPYAPSDIELSSDGSRIFVGTTYHWDDREGAACILYSDDGSNWTLIDTYYNTILAENTNKFPGRVMLSAAPSNPDIVYAAIASGYVRSDQFIGYDCNYIIKTTNKGQSWQEINLPSGFAYLAWHALSITVSPLNPNMIWVGGLDVWRTTNGGDNWTKYSRWSEMYGNGSTEYVHADIHTIKYKPGSDTDLVIGTDGGVFGTRTAPATTPSFFELNRGYSTLQYYSCAMHPDAGAIHYMGGLQDNGTMFYKRGNTPTFRDMLSGGDGALCFIDQDNPIIHITSVYHNSIYLWNAAKEANPQSRRSRGYNSGMFVNAMDYNWRDDILFANRCNEQGTYPNQIEVIGVSEDNLNESTRTLSTGVSVPFTTVKWSENSPQGQSLIYLGTQAGHVFKQEDALHLGQLTNLTPNDFPTANVSSIDIGQSNDTLLVTFSNYGVASVWYSVDGGQSWMNKESNLPDIPVRWSIIHPQNGTQVMLATELGIWTTDNILADPVIWTQNINGLANVRIDMIKIRKSDNTVLAATHGRGMFTTIWDPVFTSGIDEHMLINEMHVYPNPSNGQFQIDFLPLNQSELIISDLAGRTILHESIESQNQSITRQYNLTKEPKGTYIIILTAGAKKQVTKVLIQ
ncbi:MAG: T9SS type A sorting domain-containing protein [Bacteroidales bacterium]|nr:T9SS type A sorting domain-containing protein [Bacteroidales bacterium]